MPHVDLTLKFFLLRSKGVASQKIKDKSFHINFIQSFFNTWTE